MLSLVLTDNPLVVYLGINPLQYHRELCSLVLWFTIEVDVNDKVLLLNLENMCLQIKL